MPRKWEILDVLTRAKLLELAKDFDIEGLTGDSKENIVKTLARKRSIALEDFLERVSRDELKEICRKFGFDDKGREKAVLIERLCEKEEEQKPTSSSKPGKKNTRDTGGVMVGEKKSKEEAIEQHEHEDRHRLNNPATGRVNTASKWGQDNPHPLSQMKTELIWEGKYDEYGNRRTVDVAGASMPMQKIETIDEPASRAEAQGELFQPEKAHQDDFRNMLIWGDNKLVMASLLKDFKGKIDLIYIDPPFNAKREFNFSMRIDLGENGSSIQKEESVLEEVAFRDIWGKGTESYLHMIYDRLVLMRDLLSERGSIYVHVGKSVASYVRSICDEIFGPDNYINEITWKRSHAHGDTGQGATHFGKITDSILLYKKKSKAIWNPQYSEYTKEKIQRDYKFIDEKIGERYRLVPVDGPGGSAKGNPFYEFLGVKGYWRYSKEKMQELYNKGEIVLSSTGKSLSRIKYLKDAKGTPITDLWDDVNRISPTSNERVGYDTQKPRSLLTRIVEASSNEGDLVADFFCGSGTTGAVAEKLGRRWIMTDLGRFAVHTSRKRMIQVQRQLHGEGNQYRSFDVYNLGRYERQWWQQETLRGADEEHRRVVMEFYRAEPLTGDNGLLHGRKGQAYVHVDGIDSLFTRDEARAVAKAAGEAGAKEVHCLAWEFEMDLRTICHELEAAEGVKIKLIPIPREIMEKNRTSPPPFLEVAVLEAEPVYHNKGQQKAADIKLNKFVPSLAEVPEKELKALKERAIKSGFDFIDFWAVDFDWREGKPFEHHWQDYRTRKDRSLKTISDLGYDKYPKKGKYTACVKVIDVFGCDTSITVGVKV